MLISTRRVAIWLMLLTAAAATLVVVLGGRSVHASSDDLGAAGPRPVLSVLSAPAGPADHLPAGLADGAFGAEIASPAAARLAGSLDGIDYFIAPGKNDQVCLLRDDHVNQVTGGACVDMHQVNAGVTLEGLEDDGSRVLATLLPDGYSIAETRNVAASAVLPPRRNLQLAKLSPGSAHADVAITLKAAGKPDISYVSHGPG